MKKFNDIKKVLPVDYVVIFQLTFTFPVIKNCVEKRVNDVISKKRHYSCLTIV